jgi:sulfate/thiosulfate transport system permease protein
MLFSNKNRGVIPGFGLTLGYTILYLRYSISVVIIPLVRCGFQDDQPVLAGAFWETVTSPRVMASYRLTFSVAIAAAILNVNLRRHDGMGPCQVPFARQALHRRHC